MKSESRNSTAAPPSETLVLLVEPYQDRRDRIGGWLETAGYSLIDCPGPRREDFTCLGVRGQRCALVEVADVAVLDAGVFHEAGGDRAAATRLLHYYLTAGKPVVVVVADRLGIGVSFEDDQVAVVRRDRESVLQAVAELLEVEGAAVSGSPSITAEPRPA